MKDIYRESELIDEIEVLENNFEKIYIVDSEQKLLVSTDKFKLSRTNKNCRETCKMYKDKKLCICNTQEKKNSLIVGDEYTYCITSRPIKIKSKIYNIIIEDNIGDVSIESESNANESIVREIKSYNKQIYLDELTEAYTRKFIPKLKDIIKVAMNDRQNVCLAYLDIDDFKHFNDNYGHEFGDLVLKTLVDIIKIALKNINGYIIRQGGDEFIVVIIGITKKQFIVGMKNICLKVHNTKLRYKDNNVGISISVGCSTSIDDRVYTIDSLISVADRRLYISKEKGKNCVT